MNDSQAILSYSVRNQVYGIPASLVAQVVPLVAITAIAGAPDYLLGVINVRGDIVPVVSMRWVLGYLGETLRLTDRLIIATIDGRMVALLVDAIHEVHHIPELSISGLVSGDNGGRSRISIGDDGFVQLIDIADMLNRLAPDGLLVAGERVVTPHG